jgi:hypothetical protein
MIEERLESVAYEEAKRIYGDNSPDLLVKEAPLLGDFAGEESVDVLMYSHENYDVSMIGVYEDEMGEMRELARRWVDFFLSEGFVNVRGTLKRADRDSDYPGQGERLNGDYIFSPDLSEEDRQEIWDSLYGTVDVERILEDHREVRPENLNL